MSSPNRSYNILGLDSDQDNSSLSSISTSSSGSSYFPLNVKPDTVTILRNRVWVSNDPIDESIFDKLSTSMCENRLPKVIINPPDKTEALQVSEEVDNKDVRQEAMEHLCDNLDQVKTSRDKQVAHVAYVTNVSVASVCLCCTGQQARRCSLNVGK